MSPLAGQRLIGRQIGGNWLMLPVIYGRLENFPENFSRGVDTSVAGVNIVLRWHTDVSNAAAVPKFKLNFQVRCCEQFFDNLVGELRRFD